MALTSDERDERLQKLIEHGSERLARTLLELADLDARAEDVVKRLVTTPTQSATRVLRRLGALQQDKRFFGWRGASAFAEELRSILADIEAATPGPREGVELVAAFYRSDNQVFEMADDSGGDIGDVFRHDARLLWTTFARQCPDKDYLIGVVLELLQDDGYGVRDSVLESATEYLPTDATRTLIAELRRQGSPTNTGPLHAAAGLAKQILDPKLFESIRRSASDGELHDAARYDLAEIHLGLGEPASALEWVEEIPDTGFRRDEKRKLLLRIHERLGNVEQAEEIAWKTFREHRSTGALEDLLAVIGEHQRAHAIDESVGIIKSQRIWRPFDACFLVEVGRLGEAEACVLRGADQINGDFYSPLLYLAETMEGDQRYVCATILYRALLDSILKRAKSKIYGHGAKYLRKLAALDKRVGDWGEVEDHRSYRRRLEEQHRRKHAFWRRVPDYAPGTSSA